MNIYQENIASDSLLGKEVYYIDKFSTGVTAVVNDITKPFQSVESVSNAIQITNDDAKFIAIIFLSNGDHDGSTLPFRNIEWYSKGLVTINFIGVNPISPNAPQSLFEGKIINDEHKHINVNRIYNFIDGNISLRTYDLLNQQSFGTAYGNLQIFGTIEKIDMQCLTHTEQSQFESGNGSDFQVKHWRLNALGNGFKVRRSNIKINYLEICGNCKPGISYGDATFHIETMRLHEQHPNSAIKFGHQKLVRFWGRIFGKGNVSTWDHDIEMFFDDLDMTNSRNCHIKLGGGRFRGKIYSNNPVIKQRAGTKKNYINGLSAHISEDANATPITNVEFNGHNELKITGKVFSLKEDTINNGTLIINSTTPQIAPFENISTGANNNFNFISNGEYISNCDNVGVTFLNNDQQDKISIQDKNGIEQFKTDVLKFENFDFDVTTKTIKNQKNEVQKSAFYVHRDNGSDATGLVGDVSNPFQTIDGVRDYLVTNNFPTMSYIEIHLIAKGDYSVTKRFPDDINIDWHSALQVSIWYDNYPHEDLMPRSSYFRILYLNFFMPRGNVYLDSYTKQNFGKVTLKTLNLQNFSADGTGNTTTIFQIYGQTDFIKVNSCKTNHELIKFVYSGSNSAHVHDVLISTYRQTKSYGGEIALVSSTSPKSKVKLTFGHIWGNDVVLTNDYVDTYVYNIDTQGSVELANGLERCSVTFMNSEIECDSFRIANRYNNLTIKGNIVSQDNPLEGSYMSDGAKLRFENFSGILEDMRFSHTSTIEFCNTNIQIEGILFRYSLNISSPANIDFYGSNVFTSLTTPTILATPRGTTGFTFKDYGNFHSNVLGWGLHSTYEKVNEVPLLSFSDSASASASGLASGSNFYNTTTNLIETI
jgi:hypothetical protein